MQRGPTHPTFPFLRPWIRFGPAVLLVTLIDSCRHTAATRSLKPGIAPLGVTHLWSDILTGAGTVGEAGMKPGEETSPGAFGRPGVSASAIIDSATTVPP